MVHSLSSNALMSLEMKQEKLVLSNEHGRKKPIRASQSESQSHPVIQLTASTATEGFKI